jgi:lipopolysaccharide transport system ATP-binding protein
MGFKSITVDGLSKRYKVAPQGRPTGGRKSSLLNCLTYPVQRFRSLNGRVEEDEAFWALREVSFDVHEGEVLGIIGRNGAGKSTLLKVLSRITEPTDGRAIIRGRVGSLLEVGTGFHPELTGRENIYLNGALLGMRTAEINARFDEIVEFAEVQRFIDTPVKRYSSGMRVRLAFAVAAHLEPEILFVDEVLAVGDAAFQQRCLGKMGEVANQGRTVLLVSHQLAAIEGLCHRCVWLERGRVAQIGEPPEVIAAHLKAILHDHETDLESEDIERIGSGRARIVGFRIEDDQGTRIPAVRSGQDVTFVFSYEARNNQPLPNLSIKFRIQDNYRRPMFDHSNSYAGEVFNGPGSGELRFRIRRFPIAPGRYKPHGFLYINGTLADCPRQGLGVLDVVEGDFYRSGSLRWSDYAPFLVEGEWRMGNSTVDVR